MTRITKSSRDYEAISLRLINLDPLILNAIHCNHERKEKTFISKDVEFIEVLKPKGISSDFDIKEGIGDENKRELFLLNDSYNLKLKDRYYKATENKSRFKPGLIKFQNIESYGRSGIVISKTNRCIYYGHLIGWPLKALKNSLDKSTDVKEWHDEHSLTMVLGESQSQFKKCILMKSRGEQVYGHWIVDYIPRLYLVGLANISNNVPIIFNSLPKWALIFIEKILTASQDIIENKYKLISIKECIIPCYTKIGHTFLGDISKAAWSSLRKFFEISNQVIRQKNNGDNLPTKIFISREKVSTSKEREIHNIDQIQNISEQNGYTIIHPQDLSLFEQARLFNHAEFIVGEDGSGLHSVIFSRKKLRLIVLMSPNRMNLWHAGICEILGHQICYIEAQNIEDQSLIDEKYFKKML